MHYTVRQASALTGIAPDTLRAWERRYGVVTPLRTESRYRLYDDEDLERLRMMARLVRSGTPASLAAKQVEDALAPRLPREPRGPAPEESAPVGTDPVVPPVEPAVDALALAARTLDRAGLETAVDQAFATRSFELACEQWLLPALREVGAAWADGRIDVAGEHLVSTVVQGRLARAFDAAGTALDAPVVLVGLPPRSLHELGALSFATCLRRLGADVHWLGADLPVESWSHAVARLSPAAAVVSVPTAADVTTALAVVDRLRLEDQALLLFVGGSGAPDRAGASLLPRSPAQAAREVTVRVRGGRGGRAGTGRDDGPT